MALLVAPTMAGISAAESVAAGDSDPMLNLTSARNVEVENISAPVVSDAPTARTASQTTSATQTSAPVARAGNYLSIPGKVSSTVVGVGLDSSGAVDVPGSAIGMYNHGGAIFLDGHSTGVFAGLSRVRIGDIAEFTLNSQTTLYQVVNVVTYTYISGDSIDGSFMYDSLYSGGADGLNMMTCAGTYLPAHGTYSHRLVVFSVKI
jgi:sortase (surface protein transpeptidase)